MDREEPRRFLATWFFWVDCLFVVATLVDFVEKRRRNRPPLPDARIWFVHVWFVQIKSPRKLGPQHSRYGWPLAVSLGRGWSILWRFKRAQTLRAICA